VNVVVVVLVVLPIVGALIGFTTKWTAVKMLFGPGKFVGVGPIGWQGVVQRRAPKFAAGVAETVTGAVLDLDRVLGRISGDGVAAICKPALDDIAPALTEALVDAMEPGAWSRRTPLVHAKATATVTHEMATSFAYLVDEIVPSVASVIDTDALIIDLLSGENADRLARLFQEISVNEVRWMIRFGAFCGFAIGVVEAFAYLTFDRWWLLPLVGAFDGLLNNWLGIQMIFRPIERKRYLGLFSYQGLFPARQAEIAENYARVLGDEVLTPKHLIDRATGNPAAQTQLMGIALPTIRAKLESLLGQLAVECSIQRGGVDAASAITLVLPHVAAVIPTAAEELYAYIEQQLNIAETLRESLAAMNKLEFEKVLRSIFQEDEPLLIGIGAFLGACIGLLQAVVVVAASR
jgi:uncharacterized membrane protein YheB (UPF0754 family)